MRKKIVVLLLCCIVSVIMFLMFSALPYVLNTGNFVKTIWKEYFTVIIDGNVPLEYALGQLESSGSGQIVHLHNQTVEYFDFEGMREIPLIDIPDRFETQDPRYDRYMRMLPGYFHTRSGENRYHIVYIPVGEEPVRKLVTLGAALFRAGIRWYLPDLKLKMRLLFTGVYVLMVMVSLMYAKKYRAYFVLISLSWIPFVMTGNLVHLIAALFILVVFNVLIGALNPVLMFFLNHGYFDGGSKKFFFTALLFAGTTAASSYLISSTDPSLPTFLRFFSPWLASVQVFILFIAVKSLKKIKQEHSLFFRVPLSFTRKDKKESYQRIVLLFVVSVLMLFLPVIRNLPGITTSVEVPVPVRYEGKYTTYLLEDLHKHFDHSGTRLPGMAEYVAHRSFQEGYLFSDTYQFPHADATFGVSTFRMEEGTITKSFRQYMKRDQEWLDSVLLSQSGRGVIGMLLKQDLIQEVVMTQVPFIETSSSFLVRHLIICLVVLTPLFFLNNRLTPHAMYGINILMLRRKRQAA